MPYPARRIVLDARDYATHQSLERMAAFVKNADGGIRQRVIDYVVTAQGFSKDQTKSLSYSATLNQPGQNVGGDIRIGPTAFDQDLSWLAGIVFHELVHSPQYAYYVSNGVAQIDPSRSEIERRMIALDEFEAYSWTLLRASELSLAQAQQTEIRKRAGFALIDLDDNKDAAKSLAQKHKFDEARNVLIAQYQPPAASPSASGTPAASLNRLKSTACYA